MAMFLSLVFALSGAWSTILTCSCSLYLPFLAIAAEIFKIPRYNLEYVKKGFSYSALKVWNEIPISIRELPTLCQFKKIAKNTFDELKASQNTTPWKISNAISPRNFSFRI